MSLPRYPEYKDSGVEWLREVPAHWQVMRLRLLGTVLKGSGASKEDVVDTGIPCVRYGDLYTTHSFSIRQARTYVTADRAEEYTPILCGDILFAASGETLEEIGKSAVNLIAESACCGGDIIILRPSPDCDPLFLGHACDAQPSTVQKATMGRGTIIKHISAGDIKRLVLAVPPLAEQAQIAEFLDHETAKIDALVAEQVRLIDLLKEKHQGVISHAVTKGLNPHAPMKESSIKWLGEVPAHWAVLSLRRCLTEHRQGYYSGDPYVDAGIKLLRITDLRPFGRVETTECPQVETRDEIEPFLLRTGDFVFARTGGAGLFGLIETLEEPVAYASYLIRFRFSDRARPDFLRHYLLSNVFQVALKQNIHGGVNQNIHAEDIKNQYIALPPVAEQAAVAAFLDRETSKFETLTHEFQLAIDLLKERRAALITAAVTGQIDVRPRIKKS